MPSTINLNFLFFVNKVLKWFGGYNIGVLPWGLGFNPWWNCINISCTNVIYRYLHQGEWCENFFVDKIGKRKT
jgi:hypothetical protein